MSNDDFLQLIKGMSAYDERFKWRNRGYIRNDPPDKYVIVDDVRWNIAKEWTVDDSEDDWWKVEYLGKSFVGVDDYADSGSHRDTMFDRINSKPIAESDLMEVLDCNAK